MICCRSATRSRSVRSPLRATAVLGLCRFARSLGVETHVGATVEGSAWTRATRRWRGRSGPGSGGAGTAHARRDRRAPARRQHLPHLRLARAIDARGHGAYYRAVRPTRTAAAGVRRLADDPVSARASRRWDGVGRTCAGDRRRSARHQRWEPDQASPRVWHRSSPDEGEIVRTVTDDGRETEWQEVSSFIALGSVRQPRRVGRRQRRDPLRADDPLPGRHHSTARRRPTGRGRSLRDRISHRRRRDRQRRRRHRRRAAKRSHRSGERVEPDARVRWGGRRDDRQPPAPRTIGSANRSAGRDQRGLRAPRRRGRPSIARVRCPPVESGGPIRLLAVLHPYGQPGDGDLEAFALSNYQVARLRSALDERRVLGTTVEIGTPVFCGSPSSRSWSLGPGDRRQWCVSGRQRPSTGSSIRLWAASTDTGGRSTSTFAPMPVRVLEDVEGVDRVEEVLLFDSDLRTGQRHGSGRNVILLAPDRLFLSTRPQVVVR